VIFYLFCHPERSEGPLMRSSITKRGGRLTVGEILRSGPDWRCLTRLRMTSRYAQIFLRAISLLIRNMPPINCRRGNEPK